LLFSLCFLLFSLLQSPDESSLVSVLESSPASFPCTNLNVLPSLVSFFLRSDELAVLPSSPSLLLTFSSLPLLPFPSSRVHRRSLPVGYHHWSSARLYRQQRYQEPTRHQLLVSSRSLVFDAFRLVQKLTPFSFLFAAGESPSECSSHGVLSCVLVR